METISKVLNNTWILFVFTIILLSCQDNYEQSIISEEYVAITRTENEDATADYYWYMGQKIQINKIENKSFVLFKESDENKILASLSLAKLNYNISSIKPYYYMGTDLSGKAAKTYQKHEWMEVYVNSEVIYKTKEVVYAAPYYSNGTNDLALTNLVYVILKNDSELHLLETLAKEYNVGIIGKFIGIPRLYIAACNKESKGNALEIANAFYESGLFEGVEPAFIGIRFHTNDSFYGDQWNLAYSSQFGSASANYNIKYEQAYSLIPSSSSIVVGVVDSGIYLSHPDLNLHSYSWDALSQSSPSQIYEPHGTMVAGIISAYTNNNNGIAGIAPCIKTMSISNLLNNASQAAVFALGIREAVDQGADVINNSWGNYDYSLLLSNAIDYAVKNGRNGKGCVVVFSSGNDDDNYLTYPATYSEDDIIVVGAISYDGKRKKKQHQLMDKQIGAVIMAQGLTLLHLVY